MEGFYCRFLGGTAVCGFGLNICRGIDFECGEYLCRILIYGQVAFGRRSIVFTATLMGCSSEHYHKQTILSHCILF